MSSTCSSTYWKGRDKYKCPDTSVGYFLCKADEED